MSSNLAAILLELITFAVVVAVSMRVIGRFTVQAEVRRRLGQQVGSRPTAQRSALIKDGAVTNPILLWVRRSTSLADAKDERKLASDLSKAGIEHPAGPALYVIARFGLAISLPLGFLALQQLVSKPITGLPLIGGALVLCGLGLIAPKAVIDNRMNGRKEQLEQEFPDALDLMVVCVEAGLGLESALVRVGREVAESHPRICEEFERVSQQLAAGRGRADALRVMADRTDVESVRSFVALLIQTDTLGASIGQTLRTYSNEMRDHRYLRAEEKAMRVPVLMTIPLVACILPVIVTALMLPAVIDMIRNLMPALAGHT
jgi:tight adherence protein C